jgi:hypothetical protein
MVAASSFVRLRANGDVDFHTGERNRAGDVPPAWHKLKVLEGWNSHSAAKMACEAALECLSVRWEKACHLRKSGTEFASTEGKL